MTTLYKPHTVRAIAEVNALALTDRQENGSLVIADGMLCTCYLPYATRNEATPSWTHEDGSIHDGDEVTVLVPIEAEDQRTTPLGSKVEIQVPPSEHWFKGPASTRLVTPWEEAK